MQQMSAVVFACLLGLAATPALAQVGATVNTPPEACADPDLKGTMAAWSKPAAQISAANETAGLSAAMIAVGTRTKLSLAKDSTVKFVTPPRPDMPKEYVYAGLGSFAVPKDGNYRVATVEAMWIEVMQDGKAVTSTAFGRGPECSGKHVDFPLHAGSATLQLSGGPYPTVDVLIVPLAN